MPTIRPATPHDLPELLVCARAFHTEDGHPLPPAGEAALAALLDTDSPCGRVLVLEVDGAIGGYAALCFGYSIEFGGRDAFMDDLYVAPALRGRGYGKRLLDELDEIARAAGCRALHLEVFPGNAMAAWYKARGFAGRGNLMSKRLR